MMKCWGRIRLAGLTALLAGLSTHASMADSGLPPPIVPRGFGVNIHFTDPRPGEMERFAEAGYRFVRMDFGWEGIERTKGQYDFSAYDRLVDHLAKVNARAILICDYGNRLYDKGQSPNTEEGRAAFARFAAAGAAHFKGKGVIWEIWNEPNIDFWKPKPNADDYAKLAIATARAVREADPEATILAPGSSEFPWAFFETCFKAGLLEQIDAVSVHPYRGASPETALKDYARLRSLIARYAPANKREMPIISSEWGYSTNTKGVSEAQQARYLVRQWLSNLSAGVNLSIFYDWKDDGPDPNENEHRFGTVRQDLTPKPSFLAAKALIADLDGFSYRHRLQGDQDTDWKLLFQKDDSDALALVTWSSDPQASEADQTPAVRKIGASDPECVKLRKLASIRFPAGMLVESDEQPATLPMNIANFDTQPAMVSIEAGGESTLPSTRLAAQIPTGQASPQTLPIAARSQGERRKVALKLAWNGEELPAVKPLDVVRTDPITISVAPKGEEIVITVTNPARKVLSGRLALVVPRGRGGAAKDVAWRDAEMATVTMPRPKGTFRVELRNAKGQVVASLAARTYEPMAGFPESIGTPSGFQSNPHVENAGTTPKPLPIVETPKDSDSPAPTALEVKYEFDHGWRYDVINPTESATATIPAGARALVVWIHADESGDSLNCRLRDNTGQVHQIHLADLNWRGWRPVTIALDGSAVANHWGGTNDGQIHLPLSWDAFLLVDSTQRSKTHGGTLLVASPFFVLGE